MLNYLEAIKKIKQNKISNVYFLNGPEVFMTENTKNEILNKVLSKDDRETNLSIYDLEETSIQEVISDVETFPFFGERKVVIAVNPTFLKAKPPKNELDHHLPELEAYLKNPIEYTVFIMIASYEKIDERKKVAKLLKKETEYVSCDPVKEWDIDKWIKQIADQFQVNFEPKALERLKVESGTNLMFLQSEIEKLALYVGPNGMITEDIADVLISHIGESSGLKLMDAVLEQDLSKAIHIYKDLEKLNEEPIALLALIASQIRNLIHIKQLKEKGYNQKQIAEYLKIHPYVVKLSMNRERKYSRKELERALLFITEADSDMKQGRMDKQLSFELLLYDLIINKSNIG
ncbi:DNA polymerase III delta subunit [Saliterribacillus persicus]|uniref:DNA polymerase III subunit delta n=1 Tax=Saliterribacillus persicus TaxID=930114 RepID=A0A368XBG4_9BACI|nr:DNA polymerase III delta subunit [Saliterribacillus persicus]